MAHALVKGCVTVEGRRNLDRPVVVCNVFTKFDFKMGSSMNLLLVLPKR